MVATGVGAAVVVLAANAYHVKGARGSRRAVEIAICVNTHHVGAGSIGNVNVEARTAVAPLRRSHETDVVDANQLGLLRFVQDGGHRGVLRCCTRGQNVDCIRRDFRQSVELNDCTIHLNGVPSHGRSVTAQITGFVHIDATRTVVDVEAIACVAVVINGEDGTNEVGIGGQAVGHTVGIYGSVVTNHIVSGRGVGTVGGMCTQLCESILGVYIPFGCPNRPVKLAFLDGDFANQGIFFGST